MFDYFFHPEKVAIFGREAPLTTDTILVPLAFGRNTWSDAEVFENLAVALRAQLGYPDTDFALFDLLRAIEFDPGEVNRKLAEMCYRLANDVPFDQEAPCHIYGQWEVMYALYNSQPEWYRKYPRGFLKAVWPDMRKKAYLSTRGVLKAIPCRKEQQVALVAQEIHMARCLRVADQVIGKESVTKAPVSMPNLYDPASAQPWTRSQEAFLVHEQKARIFDALPSPIRTIIQWVL